MMQVRLLQLGRICLGLIVILSFITSLKAQEVGEATYYADKFQGKSTASGERFDQSKLTAAHKTLPFGTYVRVTNLSNGAVVDVKINDRMPKSNPRLIDLSRAAAVQIGMIQAGRAQVQVRVIGSAGDGVASSNGTPSGFRPVQIDDLPVRDQNGLTPQPQTTNSPLGGGSGQNVGPGESSRYTPTLFFMGASKTFPEGFAVQVAAFNSFYRLLEGLDEIYTKGENRTLVHSGMKNGQPIFRILVGPFESRSDAEQVRKELKRNKLDGWVVSLAELGG